MAERMNRDDRRAQIIAVARKAFIGEGYAAASMSKISEIVGGSKRTLYALFPSKKDLFFAVVDEECARLFDQLYEFGPPISEPRRAIVLFARRFLTMVLADDIIALERMVIAESVRFPQIGQAAFEFAHQRGVDRLAPFIAQAIENRILRPSNPRDVAEFLLILCTSSRLQRLRAWNVVEKFSTAEIEKCAYEVMITFLAVYGNDELAREVRQFVRS